MLSKSAFNALLKTLEEPPEHVKFLLATTDPQKLPVTVLSRCLQFNLKRLDEQQISGQIDAHPRGRGHRRRARRDPPARQGRRRQPARRPVAARPGDRLHRRQRSGGAARRCRRGDHARHRRPHPRRRPARRRWPTATARACWPKWPTLAEFSPDWGGVLDASADALHRIQVRQLVPGAHGRGRWRRCRRAGRAPARRKSCSSGTRWRSNGRRDLPLAPSPRAGFEMSAAAHAGVPPGRRRGRSRAVGRSGADARATRAQCRDRALHAAARHAARAGAAAESVCAEPAVRNAGAGGSPLEPVPAAASRLRPSRAAPSAPQRHARRRPTPPGSGAPLHAVGLRRSRRTVPASPTPMPGTRWSPATSLRGPARLLAEHAGFVGYADGVLSLSLSPTDDHLRSDAPGRSWSPTRWHRRSAPRRRSASSRPRAGANRCTSATSAQPRRAPGRRRSALHERPGRAAPDLAARRQGRAGFDPALRRELIDHPPIAGAMRPSPRIAGAPP